MNFFPIVYRLFFFLVDVVTKPFSFCLPHPFSDRRKAHPPNHLPSGQWIWIQAVSLGELLLVPPLVKKILEKKIHIHITTSTTAGCDLLDTLLRTTLNHDLVSGGFFPLDLESSLKPWINAKPKFLILMETELWPNLIRLCKKNNIPIGIVNGRLTFKSTRWIQGLTTNSLSQIDFVVARDHDSKVLFKSLGAPEVHYGGNLKAANILPEPLHKPWQDLNLLWTAQPIWVIGNTISGEEILILNLWKKQKEIQPNLRCILAPRQPNRFDEVEELLKSFHLAYTRASYWKTNSQRIPEDILLLDTVGDLPNLYQLAEFAFIGGGWLGRGGHNPLESLRYGVRTFVGPHYDNFKDLVIPLLRTESLWALPVHELEAQINNLPVLISRDLKPSLKAVFEEFGAALDRTWKVLEPRI